MFFASHHFESFFSEPAFVKICDFWIVRGTGWVFWGQCQLHRDPGGNHGWRFTAGAKFRSTSILLEDDIWKKQWILKSSFIRTPAVTTVDGFPPGLVILQHLNFAVRWPLEKRLIFERKTLMKQKCAQGFQFLYFSVVLWYLIEVRNYTKRSGKFISYHFQEKS